MAAETQTQTNDSILLRTIQEVMEGRADNTQLSAVLAESASVFNAMEAEFTQAAEAMSPQVKEQVGVLVESAHGFFEQIRVALSWSHDYLKSGDKNLLFATADTIIRCTHQLDLLFLHLKNTAWSLQGPTEIANLNALLWAYDFYVSDSNKKDVLRTLALSEQMSMPIAIQEISIGVQTPEILALKEAFEAHGACAARLVAALDAGKNAELDQEIDAIETTFVRLKELIPAANISQRESGPTQSPQVNVVIGLTNDLINQKIQDIVLMQALDVLYHNFLQSKAYFAQMSGAAQESVMLEEEISRGCAAIELQETALKGYSEFFQNRMVPVLERAKVNLKISAGQLFDCHEALQAMAEREGKTLCIRCSHYNPAQRSTCEKCGMALPVVIKETVGSSTFETQEGEARRPVTEGPVLTANLVRLYAAVDKIAEETITDEEYLGELTWFENLLEKNSSYINEEPDLEAMNDEEREVAEVQIKLMEEIDEVFQEALNEFDEGLVLFRQYPENRSRGDLEEGVRLCNSAAQKMVSVRDVTKARP